MTTTQASKIASSSESGEWSAEDRIGAGNHLSESTVLQAIGLVREGRIIDLTLAAGVAAPRIPGANSPFVISMWSHPFVSQANYVRRGAKNGVGSLTSGSNGIPTQAHTSTLSATHARARTCITA